MPTTIEETKTIARIFDTYIPKENLKSFLSEMLISVAYKTENYSVRSSLFSLAGYYIQNFRIPEDLIDDLIDKWHADKTNQHLLIYEFIGMTESDWNDYCQGNYQCF